MTTEQSSLSAVVDGALLADDAARDLWKRFSDYMGEHRGDLDGFAKNNGFVRIAPEYRNGKALLVAYTKEPTPAHRPANPSNRSKRSRRRR